MQRRTFLRAGSGVAGSIAIAGCLSTFGSDTQSSGEPSLVENRPDAVYIPTHVEGMQMIDTARHGDRTVALSYTYAHRFWTVTGTRTERVNIQEDDTIHLMASVWDTETGTILPVGSGLRFEIRQDGETVDERSPWPMLSQPMGFHFGDNVALPGDGTYTVVVDVGAMNLERRGPFAGKFGNGGTVEVDLEYSQAERDEIMFRPFDDQQGERGAASPMEMEMLPLSVAPAREDLPGRTLGEAESGDAVFLATAAGPETGNEEQEQEEGKEVEGTYLAVSPRTPHNRYVLAMMSLSATLERDGTVVFEGPLQKAIDPEYNYHYGAGVDGVESGDELTITVDAPSQVSRHEGYETAFLDMPEMTLTVS